MQEYLYHSGTAGGQDEQLFMQEYHDHSGTAGGQDEQLFMP
jgi:hypothetical protein